MLILTSIILLVASCFFLLGAWKFAGAIDVIKDELKQITKQLIYLNDRR